MRLDDLAADGQAEAGILAERLARWPVGVEALEDAVDLLDRMPGPLSSTVTMTWRVARDSVMRMRPLPSGTKERAFSIRFVITWPSRKSCPMTRKPRWAKGPRSPANSMVTGLWTWRFRRLPTARSPTSFFRSTVRASSRASSASRREASEMSVISRSRRRTSCWMTSSRPLARFVVLGERQRLDRASQRCQRVLQLMATSAAKLSIASMRA
jgi:hypothetical protein